MSIADEIKQNILDGNIDGIQEMVKKAHEDGMEARTILLEAWCLESRRWADYLKQGNISFLK